MSGWFQRQTSMRGRLAILLVMLLVLPLIGVGWLGYRAVARAQLGEGGTGRSEDMEAIATLRVDEAVRGLQRCLEQNVADMALRVAHLSSADPAAVTAAFADLPEENRPCCVALLRPNGDSAPPLQGSWLAALSPFVRGDRASSGCIVLPAGGLDGAAPRPESLYQVVIEPRAGGASLVALRDLSSAAGRGVLAGLPFGASVCRSVTLRDQRVLATSVGTQSDEAHRDGGSSSLAASLAGDLWHKALGQEAVYQERRADWLIGAAVLRDLGGAPAGLAIVQADDQDLFPLHGRPAAIVSLVLSYVGWIALVGVLLAIGIGLAAPRWVWSDIKDSTETIFGSVDRLRELVRRNSRAIEEQSRLIQSVMASASALETDSQSIAQTSRTLANSAEQSAWVSQSGNQRAEVSQRAVVDVRDRVEDISSQMEELERRCAAIGSMLGFIDHLSNETNTLSINATIQAVGSGSSGREFSVVASEIRKLADLALDSTQDIKHLVGEIQESSRTTLGATQEGCREVDKCLASFEELESSFARILRWVELTTQSARGIETSTARQSNELKSVVQSIEALRERADEAKGNFHDVVAAADELSELGGKMNETWRVG